MWSGPAPTRIRGQLDRGRIHGYRPAGAGRAVGLGRHLPPRRALVAWDGSREARAAGDAIPLLKSAEDVVVLTVDAHRGRRGSATARASG